MLLDFLPALLGQQNVHSATGVGGLKAAESLVDFVQRAIMDARGKQAAGREEGNYNVSTGAIFSTRCR